VTRRDRAGSPIDGFAAQIASICAARGAALATRNLKDFQNTGWTCSTRGSKPDRPRRSRDSTRRRPRTRRTVEF